MKNKVTPDFDDENGCLKKGKQKVWKFVHHEDYKYTTNLLQNRTCDFNWLNISENGTITVKGSRDKGYFWDGCTPKMNFLHITWGIFDGKLKRFGKGNYKPYTYYASMIHDVLYQYKRCAPVTRKEADRIFYIMLKESGFMWAGMFYIGVRLFGWFFCGWKYKSKKN
ncbi:DUF1353 domain-containing protein [Bacteroidota bacterium]